MIFISLCVTVLDSLGGNTCPPFGKKAKFEVKTIHTKSLMYGCAYSGNQSLSSSPFFHIWLESSEHTGPHAHCDNTRSTYNESFLLQHTWGRVRYTAPVFTVKLSPAKTIRISYIIIYN